ncbi:MAG: hypothetical protein HFJ26_06850 [Clostridia bacterium]|jgi:hypothetical protein|nr:hypothetical protein [Clostridia bacterium]
MVERNNVGDYITKKALEVVEMGMKLVGIEIERTRIADFISEAIGKDIIQQRGINPEMTGWIDCRGNNDGEIFAHLHYTTEEYKAEIPMDVFPAIVELEELLKEETEKKISLTDVEFSDDGKDIKFAIAYDFGDR